MPDRYILSIAYPAGLDEDIGEGADGFTDFVSPEVLERLAWNVESKTPELTIEHQDGTQGAGHIVESYIYRGPDYLTDSGQKVEAGDWLVGSILDPITWELFQSGELTGLSIEGEAQRQTGADGSTFLKQVDLDAISFVKSPATGKGVILAKQEAAKPQLVAKSRTQKVATSRARINDLPDSDFALIEPGGEKDEQGKTVPRSLRHLPIFDAVHVRNALARLADTNLSQEQKKKAFRAIQQKAETYGVAVSERVKNLYKEEVTKVAETTAERQEVAAEEPRATDGQFEKEEPTTERREMAAREPRKADGQFEKEEPIAERRELAAEEPRTPTGRFEKDIIPEISKVVYDSEGNKLGIVDIDDVHAIIADPRADDLAGIQKELAELKKANALKAATDAEKLTRLRTEIGELKSRTDVSNLPVSLAKRTGTVPLTKEQVAELKKAQSSRDPLARSNAAEVLRDASYKLIRKGEN